MNAPLPIRDPLLDLMPEHDALAAALATHRLTGEKSDVAAAAITCGWNGAGHPVTWAKRRMVDYRVALALEVAQIVRTTGRALSMCRQAPSTSIKGGRPHAKA
jgi:hypothetical protein